MGLKGMFVLVADGPETMEPPADSSTEIVGTVTRSTASPRWLVPLGSVHVVLMTSVADPSLEVRASEAGAAFLKKPFYPADISAVLCRFYGLRALNSKRA